MLVHCIVSGRWLSHVDERLGFPELSSRFESPSESLIAVAIGHFKWSCQRWCNWQMARHLWIERYYLFWFPKAFVSFFIIKVWLRQCRPPKFGPWGYCLESGGCLCVLELADSLKVALHRLKSSIANIWLPFQNWVWSSSCELAQVGDFEIALLFVDSGMMLVEGLLTVHLGDACGLMPQVRRFNVIVDLRVAFIVTLIQILDARNPEWVVQSMTRSFLTRVSA